MLNKSMLKKTYVGAVLLAATAVSTTAMAQDRGFNTVAGAVIGAAIGNTTHDRNGALIGGVLGAAVGNSIPTNDRYYDRGYSNNGYYANSGAYVDTRSSYYDNRSSYYQPAPVYVEPRPVYYAPAPSYYYSQPSAVVYVGGGRGYYGGRGGYGHGGHGGHHR